MDTADFGWQRSTVFWTGTINICLLFLSRSKYHTLFPAFFCYNMILFPVASLFITGNGTPDNPQQRSAVTDG
jgi:hypothetical protein